MLIRQILRGIWRQKRTFAACILLLALGIASYAGFTATSRQLVKGMQSMYTQSGFGDVFATVKGIPSARAEDLSKLEGIAQASAAMAVDVRVEHEGEAILTLRVLSCGAEEDNTLNRMTLMSGTFPSPGEIVVSQQFFEAQGLSVGDQITLVANGKQVRPTISGTAISAAYIVPAGEGMSGDGLTSGYAYMPTVQVQALLGNNSLMNQVTFLLDEGFTFDDVEAALEDALNRYGLVSLYSREDHPSHNPVWENFAGLEGTATMIAFVFLSVSVLVLYILLRRVIEQERIQIGTLKAFGVSSGKILLLYLGYGGAVGLTGGLLGSLLGILIANLFTAQYLVFFPMPEIPFQLEPGVLVTGLIISALAGTTGALMGARSVLRLSPAEAMRPAAPPVYRKKAAKRQPLADLLLSTTGFMALRSISRSKFRSGFVLMGMGVSFSILVFMSSYAAIADSIMMDRFNQVQLYDMKLSLEQPAGYNSALASTSHLSGVDDTEGVLELAVTFYNGHLQADAALTGLEMDSSLQKIYDSTSKLVIDVPANGAVISNALAQKLEAVPGDTLYFTTNYTGKERIPLIVTDVVFENMGATAYMDLGQLCSTIHTPKSINQILISTSAPSIVKESLGNRANAPVLSDQKDLKNAMQADLDSTLGVNVGIFCIIGLGVAFAIIASTSSISFSERGREFATLRVLGMHPKEIGAILGFEYWLLTLLGILLGIPLALGLRALIASSMSTDAISISPGIDLKHYLVAAGICLLAVAITNRLSVRRIAKLDMPDVLKERE